MTWTDDYPGEMPALRQIDDRTAEQLLAGRPATAELESVATVVRALREASAQPVRPSSELARQMAAGVFSGTPVYTYRPALGPRLLRRARRVATPGRISLAARLAAAGAGVALVGAGTAGFAGTLPEPVQDRFETVVESVSPYEFPEKAADPDGRGGRVPAERDGGGAVDPGDDPGDDRDPGSPEEFGGEVSEDARDGGVDGGEVSEDARDRNRNRPDDLPPPAREAPGQQRRPTAPPGQP